MRWLWPIPVVGFVVYPYLKRFTWLCHLWLGAVDGLAPVGAWVAITGQLPWQAWMLGAAVAFWIAGFDFFYALFDEEVDRREGPALDRRRGSACAAPSSARGSRTRRPSRASSRWGSACRSASSTGSASPSSPRCSAYEHSLVRPGDLRRLDTAFFTMNGVISVVFAVFVILDAVS